MPNKITYTVTEDKENPLESTITKLGDKVEFTMGDLMKHEEDFTKQLTEYRGKLEYEMAIMKNIEKHHKWVKDLDAEKLHTITLYVKAKAVVDQLMQPVAKMDADLQIHKSEMKEIIKQTGIQNAKEETNEEASSEKIDAEKKGS